MKTLKENLNEMRLIAKKMPKTVNEAIDFEDNMMGDYPPTDVSDVDAMAQQEPEMQPELGGEMGMEEPGEPKGAEIGDEPIPGGMSGVSRKAAELIDNIRKESLRAMAELADTPEDENYLMLKKIWQMTDRKPESEKKEQ